MMNQDLTAYVLVRTDLPSLTPGKAMAQVHHLGVQLVSKHQGDLVNDYVMTGIEQGADHFNTTIVLGATLSEIEQVLAKSTQLPVTDVIMQRVVDPSYPFFVENEEIADLIPCSDTLKVVSIMQDGRVLMTRQELTCVGFLGDRANPEFRALFDGLHLHP